VTTTTLVPSCAPTADDDPDGIGCLIGLSQRRTADGPLPRCPSECNCGLEVYFDRAEVLFDQTVSAASRRKCRSKAAALRRTTTGLASRVRTLNRRSCFFAGDQGAQLSILVEDMSTRAKALAKSDYCLQR
jgi:hypothetical protein